jgi:hypothetical protein
MSSVKSPREKKRLAYDRDHVTAAEYPHAFRKQWPRKKARANRACRRQVRQVLQAADGEIAVHEIRREQVQKWGVVTVRTRIEQKREKRQAMVGAHKARRARRQDV